MNEGANRGIAVPKTSRLLIFYLSVVLWFVAVSVRLVQLQVVESDDYQEQALRQRKGYVDLHSRRGEILDCHLEEFVISVEAGVVQAHPHKVVDPAGAARKLAPILGRTEQEIYDKLISGNAVSVPCQRDLSTSNVPSQAAEASRYRCCGGQQAGLSQP